MPQQTIVPKTKKRANAKTTPNEAVVPRRTTTHAPFRYITLEDSLPSIELRQAIGAVVDCGNQLASIGSTLFELRAMSGKAGVAEIEHAAATIQANATQALLLAAEAREMAGRFRVIASIIELDQTDEPEADELEAEASPSPKSRS